MILGLVAAVVILEGLALPLPLQPVPSLQQSAPWQLALDRLSQPPQIVMLPFAASSRVADFEQTTRWMLESRYFQGRMLNGYSGFFPRHHPALREQMQAFPSRHSIDFLGKLQTDYVVIHHRLAGAPPAQAVSQFLQPVYQDDQNNVTIYAVRP